MKSNFKFILLIMIFTFFIIPSLFASYKIYLKEIDMSKYEDSRDISIRFYIENENGSPFLNLKKEDVRLTISSMKSNEKIDDFEIEKIVSPDHPLNLAMLVDCSESMKGAPFSNAKSAIKDFLSQLRDIDRIMIIGFADDINVKTDFEADKYKAMSAVDSLSLGEYTLLYDAINESIERTKKLPPAGRAIILITDGRDSQHDYPIGSKLKLDDIVSKIASSNIPIYAIGLGNVDKDKLERIVKASGGRTLYTPDPTEIKDMYQEILNLLKDEYIITFKDPIQEKSRIRKIALKVNISGNQYEIEKSFLINSYPNRQFSESNKEKASLNIFWFVLIVSVIVGAVVILVLLLLYRRNKTPPPASPIPPPS